MRRFLALLAAPALAGAGCGGGPNDRPAAKPHPSPTHAAAVPARMVGTFRTSVKRSDLPADTPVELLGRYTYRLTVTKGGGVDNAPTLGVVIPNVTDPFVHGDLSVSGSTLTLRDEPCVLEPVGIVTSTYRWKLSGAILRLTAMKDGCKDSVSRAVLTSRPWTKGS